MERRELEKLTTMEDFWSAAEIAMDEDLIKQVENGNIRKCCVCGLYVPVEESNGEFSHETGCYDDICGCCEKKVIDGVEKTVLEPDYYEDFIEDEDDEDDEDEDDEDFYCSDLYYMRCS